MPVTSTPPSLPSAALLAWACTKRSWNTGASPLTESFMLAMLSETASIQVRYTPRPEPAVFIAPKIISAAHRRLEEAELGVHRLDHRLVLQVRLDHGYRFVVQLHVVPVDHFGVGGGDDVGFGGGGGIAVGHCVAKARLEVDARGLEARRLHVGHVVGRHPLPLGQAVHGAVDDVHRPVGDGHGCSSRANTLKHAA